MIDIREYEQEFLPSKKFHVEPSGFDVPIDAINPILYPFQRTLVQWALRMGKAGLYADTGLGKTFMHLESARLLAEHTKERVLILAPLSVAYQTVDESRKLGGIDIFLSRNGDIGDCITIANYENIKKFNPDQFHSVLADESSILKAIDGKTSKYLRDAFQYHPYRQALSATPSPNDAEEWTRQAEFLGVGTRDQILSTFFFHDESGWKLRPHAAHAFYDWMTSWAMMLSQPSDIGDYSDDGFKLPELRIEPLWLESNFVPEGQLCFTGLKGIEGRLDVRKGVLQERVEAVLNLVNDGQQWILWHALNPEGTELAKLIPDSVLVEGKHTPEQKAQFFKDFKSGKHRILITKPKIAAFGLNLQNCFQQAFVGMGDSWEQYYQCIRRSLRHGQQSPYVRIVPILMDIEDAIYKNLMSKEQEATETRQNLISHVRGLETMKLSGSTNTLEVPYETAESIGDGWQVWHGDSTKRLGEMADGSVDLVVTSIPFLNLFAYSASPRDLGNSKNPLQFARHMRYIARQLYRIVKPGRVVAIHVTDVPAMLVRDGYIGLKDFSGMVIRLMERIGFVFDARVPIDKNQQAQSIRTRSKALTMKSMETDRSWIRPGLPDYVLKFRRPGTNANPIAHDSRLTRDEWIDFANPTWPGYNSDGEEDRCADSGAMATWYGIRESDTVQGWRKARENDDEPHVCPLQLETIERCIRLWSLPGDVVLDPFSGVGSTGVVALRLGNRYHGIELKKSYYVASVDNLKRAERFSKPQDMFSWLEQQQQAENTLETYIAELEQEQPESCEQEPSALMIV